MALVYYVDKHSILNYNLANGLFKIRENAFMASRAPIAIAQKFRVMGGEYRYIGNINSDEVDLYDSLDELVDITVDIERSNQMEAKLLEMRTFDVSSSSIHQFLNLQSFGEANEFFSTHSIILSASALANLTTFLAANIKMFGENHPIDAIALQTLFDIITSQKELYILIGAGGESSVYKKGYLKNDNLKSFIPVSSGCLSDSGARRISPESSSSETNPSISVALKVLKNVDSGGYDSLSPEVIVSRDRSRSTTPSPLLMGSCVKTVQVDRFSPVLMALCMEMGVSSMDTFFSKETNVGRRLVKVLQMAELVANLAAQGLVHRDLKPGNFMLTASGGMVIIDPSQIQKVGSTVEAIFTTIVYSSPRETLGIESNEMVVNYGIDVWSLGMILYEAVSGSPPKLSSGIMKSVLIFADGAHINLILPDVAPQKEWDEILEIIKKIGLSLEDSLDALRDVQMLKEEGYKLKTVGDSDYLSNRTQVIRILNKPFLDLSTDDFKFLKLFLESNYKSVLEETHCREIQSILTKIRTIQTNLFFDKYPELKMMCKKLIAVKPEDRGSASDFVFELSSFLESHPEFLT